jgi:hypothetical protein
MLIILPFVLVYAVSSLYFSHIDCTTVTFRSIIISKACGPHYKTISIRHWSKSFPEIYSTRAEEYLIILNPILIFALQNVFLIHNRVLMWK